MAPPLYKPPTKVVTTQIPWLSVVTRGDPEWARGKFYSLEYERNPAGGQAKFANPYQRWPFTSPTKKVLVNYAGPATFNAGDLTGVGNDFVKLLSQNAAPGALTTRTAAQMFGDIVNAAVNLSWALRVINFGGSSPLTLAAGAGVSFQGVMPVSPGMCSDFLLTFLTATTLQFLPQTQNYDLESVPQ